MLLSLYRDSAHKATNGSGDHNNISTAVSDDSKLDKARDIG